MSFEYRITNETAKNIRTADLGFLPGQAEEFGKDFARRIFTKANFCRHFELKVQAGIEAKIFKIPIYLSLGTEYNSAVFSEILSGWNVFGQHRCHSLFLNLGGDPAKLRDELLGLPTSAAGGMSGSNAVHDLKNKMFGHSGLMGEQVPIAVGAALASGQPCLTICGDASVEEDYIYPSLGFAATKQLPVIFVCEDNDLRILTEVKVRRNWNPADMARSLGMVAVDIADDPWTLAYHLKNMKEQSPGFINLRSVRILWHAGGGTDGPPEWDRYQLVYNKLVEMGLGSDLAEIDRMNQMRAEELWREVLPKQSKK